MKRPHIIELERDERLIAVVPEYCEGPGWRNSPLWVYIERQDKTLRTECIQPADQTSEQRNLFQICNLAHSMIFGTVKTTRKAA